MIRGILFDIDGTLIDHQHAQSVALEAFHTLHREEDALADLESFIGMWERASTDYYTEYITGTITFDELRALRTQYVYGIHGISLDMKEAYELYEEYEQLYEQQWRLYPDVMPCLESLGEYRLGAISNGGSGQQRRKLSATGIGPFFSVQIMSEDIGVAKPNKGIFEHAIREMGLRPEEIAIVGDDYEADIKGGIAAGLKAVHVVRGASPLHAGAHASISSLASLQEALSLLE